MSNSFITIKPGIVNSLLLIIGAGVAIMIGWATANNGLVVPFLAAVLAFSIPFVITILRNPRIGFVAFITYCFCLAMLSRLAPAFPFTYGLESLLILSWIGALFHSKLYAWQNLKNELCFLGLIWFGVTIMELANPEAGSFAAWISDARYPLLWLLCIPLCFLFFNKNRDLNIFLGLILLISLVAALYGIKQLKLGLTGLEKDFVAKSTTHMIFGKLRVFSFYLDAGQFGASMAQLSSVALVLALGPFKTWKRVSLAIAGLVLLYGMIISGTRGALFAFLAAMLVSLIITRNTKVFAIGSAIVVASFVFLKYTSILNDNAEIRRMRSALHPDDASLNLRLRNQVRFNDYLSSRPFGAGVGALGYAGKTYNKGTYISSIPPDSYWVKVWAMYGIVGLIIWFGIMMYILGKCCGIVWKTRDPKLRFKLAALTAGSAGIFICSYGNEVMNNMPSAAILYISWAFVFLGPKLDKKEVQVQS